MRVLWVLRSRTGSALPRLFLRFWIDICQALIKSKLHPGEIRGEGSSGDVEVSLDEANPSLQERG